MRRCFVALSFLALACEKEGAPVPERPAPPPASSPAKPATSPSATPADNIIRNAADVKAHLGEVITLEGVVERSKQPTLLGVDVAEVDSDGHDARGKRCRATGRLEKRELVVDTKPISAHRSPGTYYALVRTEDEGLAIPVPLAP